MAFTKILCPTDFSPGAEGALRAAARLAAATGAELVVAHAWYIPTTAYTLEAPFSPSVQQRIVDDAERGLDVAVRLAKAAGATYVSSKLLTGVPWAELIQHLERQAFDLCVIGTHGRTGLARILLGSVAEKVVRHAPCSVLTMHRDGEVTTFAHALVPTDFSEHARHALDLAPVIIAPGGAITLLHVVEIPVAFPDVPALDHAAQVEAALDREAARVRGTTAAPVATRSRIGSPSAQTLAALDADPTIDLVVMGSRGRTGIKRAILGSVAEQVVRHARCPVLVARPRT
jgi:nucleotide-binding universal stress UspA family protein